MTQIARENIKLDNKQLNKELAEKMLNRYYFFDRNLKVGFKIILDSHHFIHANSKLTIIPKYPEFSKEVRYNNKIKNELSFIYAILLNQYIFKYQTKFSAKFDKQDEDNQVLVEKELFIILNINHNITQTYINDIVVKSPLEHQIH